MRTNLEIVIKERLKEINIETEEGLILMMTTEVIKNAHEKTTSTKTKISKLKTVNTQKTNNTLVKELKNKEEEKNGYKEKHKENVEHIKAPKIVKDTLKYFYVYTSHSILDWEFSKCVTIEEAIKKAVLYIDAYIIYDGNIIKYDAIDDSTAYYYKNNKKYIVNIA